MLNNRFVYLAGPIDQCLDVGESKHWRQLVSVIFARYGYATFSPAHAYENVERTLHADAVNAINNAAIINCSVIFVNFCGPTLGSVREIEYASRLGKQIFLYSTINNTRDMLGKSFATVDCHIISEPMLGDAIREMVKAIRRRDTLNEETQGRVESGEDE